MFQKFYVPRSWLRAILRKLTDNYLNKQRNLSCMQQKRKNTDLIAIYIRGVEKSRGLMDIRLSR